MSKKIQLTKNGEDVYPITVPDSIAGLAQVAKTGSYNDLSDRPEGSNIFVVTPEVTLLADINAAYAAGKMIILLNDDYIYTLERVYSGEGFYFTSVNGDEKEVKYWNVSVGDTWNSGSFLLEDSGVFLATYGATTITQIKDAYDSGKLVVCRKALGGDGFIYAYLSTIGSNFAHFITTLNFDYYFSTYSVNSRGWSMSEEELIIPTALSQLDDDSTHRLVTDTEKATWNAKYTKPASGIPASDLSDAVKYADELKISVTLDEQSETTAYVLPDDFNNIFAYKPRVITVTIPEEEQTMSFMKITEMSNYDQQDHSILLYGISMGDTNIILQIAENAPTVDGKRQVNVETMEVENTSHKVTTISSSSDNMQYPSAKCVYDAIQASNTPEIFWATYGTTTAAEIDAAVAAGKAVMCRYNNSDYVLSKARAQDGYYYFGGILGSSFNWLRLQIDNTSWVAGLQSAQLVSNKVNSWQATPDNNHYPSEKLVKDSIDAVDKVFWATYGTTTYAEVLAAYNAGKLVACLKGGYTFRLEYIDGNSAFFSARYAQTSFRQLGLTSSDSWSESWRTVETDSNKVSTISGNESNTSKYLSTKGSYDAIHPAIATTQPAGGFLPNILYNLGTLSGNTTFALATPADANVVNHYYWTFDTGSTAPTITWPTGLTWFGGSAPYIDASKHYEISVLNGIGVAMEV